MDMTGNRRNQIVHIGWSARSPLIGVPVVILVFIISVIVSLAIAISSAVIFVIVVVVVGCELLGGLKRGKHGRRNARLGNAPLTWLGHIVILVRAFFALEQKDLAVGLKM